MHRSARARGVGSLDMTAGEKRRRTQEPHRRRARPTSPPRDPSAAARGSSAAASGGCGQWSAEVTPPRRETHAGCAQERERRGLQGDRRCGGERRRGATGSPSEDCDPKHGEGDTTRGRRTEDSGPFGVRQGFRWTRPSRMGRARAALGTSHPEAHQRVQIHWRGGRSRTAAIGAHPTGGGRRSGGAAGAVRVCANARPSNGSAPDSNEWDNATPRCQEVRGYHSGRQEIERGRDARPPQRASRATPAPRPRPRPSRAGSTACRA